MIDFIKLSKQHAVNVFNDFLDLIYPPVCGLCGGVADTPDRLVCQKCLEKIAGLESSYCLNCRQFLRDSLRCLPCGDDSCSVFSLGYYEGDLEKLIYDLKFSGLKPLGGSLGSNLAELIISHKRSPALDYIVPVPLHPSREYQRGFNQSAEIARGIGVRLGVEVLGDILYATRKTRQQARLPAAMRQANVRGAFAVDDKRGKLVNRSILLVDDVTTTGSTLRENIRILKDAGAAKVVAAVAATAA